MTALAGGSTIVTVWANGGQVSATVAVDTPPSVSITSPVANTVFQSPATTQISASAADPDGSVARVDFYQGGTLIGSATSAPYNFIWTNVAPGSYMLTAVATDNQGSNTASAAVTIRVNAPPAVAITSPTTGTSFTAPATIPLTADASDPDGTIASVTFYQGTVPIGTVTTAPYSFIWTNVAQGTYALTAVATDSDGAVTTSTGVNVAVNSGVAQVYYIVPDHLNTPRSISDQNGKEVWRWDNTEPYGNSVPNGDPNNIGVAFDFPLRFSGQFFDRETGLAYNLHRNYAPDLDRYVEADLIGIRGGINVYLYVGGNPLSFTDTLGLQAFGAPAGGAAPARPPQAPRIPICLRWICKICEDVLSDSCPPKLINRCTTFIVNAPPGHPTDPGSGGFAGPGGFAGDAKKMPGCICTDSVPYPY